VNKNNKKNRWVIALNPPLWIILCYYAHMTEDMDISVLTSPETVISPNSDLEKKALKVCNEWIKEEDGLASRMDRCLPVTRQNGTSRRCSKGTSASAAYV